MDQVTQALAGAVIAVISAGGYLGIAFLMALESACLPLPSEVIMPFAGYLASTGRFALFLVATAGAVGCNLGSAVAYAAGRHGGRRFIDRWGRYVLLDPGHVDWAERFFARHGGKTVFIGRLLPIVRTFIALPAGIARMPQVRFHVLTFLGSWPWCFVLAYAGYKLGEQWDKNPELRRVMHDLDLAILVGIFGLIVWRAWGVWRSRRKSAARER